MTRTAQLWRRTIFFAAVVSLVVLLSACGGDDEQPAATGTAGAATGPEAGLPNLEGTTITYVGFGGSLDEAFKKAWFDPFSEATGATILLDSPTDFTKIKTQVESGNVQWDIIDGEPFFINPDCGVLFEELDVDTSAVSPEFKPETKCEVPETIYHSQIVYSNQAFPNGGPEGCEDFFDTAKFPGKRALFGYAEAGILECASIAVGANPDHPYPIDLDKVFDLLNSVKEDVVIYDSATESQDMLENNDVAMCICLGRAIAPAVNNGADITPVWEPAFRQRGAFAVPKGSPNKEAAEALLNYIMKPEVNERAQQYLIYGLPTGADPNLAAPEVQEYVSTGQKVSAGALDTDLGWWTQNGDEVFERWGQYTIG